MLIKEFAVAASVFALTACAGAQADLAEADHVDHYAFGFDGDDYRFSSSGLTREELIELRREINEEVREELAEARLEIREALAETRIELEARDIEALIDADGQLDVESLSEAVLMSVQTALQQAQRGLEKAERQLARDEVRRDREAEQLERQVEHMARQAERMNRKAAEMKARAEAMKRDAEQLKREEEGLRKEIPNAPTAPPTNLIEPEKSALARPAASFGESSRVHRRVPAPFLL